MKIAFKTLGCRLNQHETDALVSAFDDANFEVVPFKQSADVTVINTCTVTKQSDHKSRNIIQQAIKSNPKGKVVVTGCMAEQFKTELEKIPGVSLVINNPNKANTVEMVNNLMENRAQLDKELTPDVFNYQPVKKSLHTRAAIKIQDGCDNFCTFCIIPQVRGRAVSRPVNEILESIRQTINNGFKEIVVTGVNIGRYYHEGVRFVQLLEKILALPGDFRIRISSLEPDGFGNDLIDLFENPKLAPHLHLCLQSGSEKILLKMRRMYSVDNYLDLTQKIVNRYPEFNLTTDIIVGFPGETEADFRETQKIVNQIGFSHIHTFKYSVRESTAAERMPNQVDEKIKQKRSEKIREMSAENQRNYLKKFVGNTQKVLVEKHLGNGWYKGYGQHYIPVKFKHATDVRNQFIDIEIDNVNTENEMILVGTSKMESVLVIDNVFST